MSVFGVKLPDVGEGVAEAELIEWYVDVGDRVTPDTVLADVMTDKATVEISSPVTGVVTFRVGEPGEVLAVGTEFVGIELDGSAPSPDAPSDEPADEPPDEPTGRAGRPDEPAGPRSRRRSRPHRPSRSDPNRADTDAAAAAGHAPADRRSGGPGASRGARDRPVRAHRFRARRARRPRRPRPAVSPARAPRGSVPPAPRPERAGAHDETVIGLRQADRRTPHDGVDRDPPHHLRRRRRRDRPRSAARRAEPQHGDHLRPEPG